MALDIRSTYMRPEYLLIDRNLQGEFDCQRKEISMKSRWPNKLIASYSRISNKNHSFVSRDGVQHR